jgi:hypothetical protein
MEYVLHPCPTLRPDVLTYVHISFLLSTDLEGARRTDRQPELHGGSWMPRQGAFYLWIWPVPGPSC